MRKFGKPSGNRSGKGEKDKGGYKAKRSFSKDRSSDDKGGYAKKSRFGSSDGEKKPFSRDKKFGDKEKRPFKRDNEGGEKKSYRSFDKKDSGKSGYRDKKPFDRDKKFGDKEKRPFKRDGEGGYEKKSYRSFDKKDSDKGEYKEKRSFKKEGEGYEKKPFRSRDKSEGDFKEKRPYKKRETAEGAEPEELSYKQKRSFTRNKELRKTGGFKKEEGHHRPFDRNDKYSDKGKSRKPFTEKANRFDKDNDFEKKPVSDEKPFKKKFEKEEGKEQRRLKYDEFEEGKGFSGGYKKDKDSDGGKKSSKSSSKSGDGTTRLNKYLAHAGIASRREADTLIKSGVVKVNGVPITEMGFKVKAGDTVTYGDASVKSERKVYLLLNKPKDYITTVDDPQERKTVMNLIEGACKERVYPVGRLDRNTTGLLLFTNDGELTKKLTHPKHEIKKVYHVSLNKGLTTEDFQDILAGVELEDGPIKADDLAFVGEGKKEVGIEIHSGRNRIVRRLFEHLGYEILKLDRITFAGLTKKDIPRGKYRFLTQKEVSFLQMIG